MAWRLNVQSGRSEHTESVRAALTVVLRLEKSQEAETVGPPILTRLGEELGLRGVGEIVLPSHLATYRWWKGV